MDRLGFEKLIGFVVIVVAALTCGYALAMESYLMALAALGGVWLMLLPYHTKLSIYLSVATYSSALIVPLFPGRPYIWEFAALLGWSGLLISIFMRRYAAGRGREIRANRWIFIGTVGYSLVLFLTMATRGFGLRILNSEQMGGRYYFQQISCAIFPWLFVMTRLDEKTVLRLVTIQCLLTFTYLISDFVLSIGPKNLWFLLDFFELSGDAVNFEMRAMQVGGIRRYQSLFQVATGLFFITLIYFNLRDFLSRKGLYLLPFIGLILGGGLLSGHRYLALIVGGVVLGCIYAQKFLTLRNALLSVLPLFVALFFLYGYVDRMPLAIQRAVSFLPGISVEKQAEQDGEATIVTRRILRHIGMQMIPQYFWAGRGFGMAREDYSMQWDPTVISTHLAQGRFFNGFIGLMINTGIFGTFFMFLFQFGGTLLAWRIAQHLRTYGCEDSFSRMCSVLVGLWFANVVAFWFLHGDSEYAMKTFSLQTGLLISCHVLLRQRLGNAAAAETEPVLNPEPSIDKPLLSATVPAA